MLLHFVAQRIPAEPQSPRRLRLIPVRRLDPARVIIGVPVGSDEACDRLRKEVDVLVCLAMPDLFFAVGEWYRDFKEVSDAEVRRLLAEGRQQLPKHPASATTA